MHNTEKKTIELIPETSLKYKLFQKCYKKEKPKDKIHPID